ncbi:hypothetical protein QQ045_010218 [Rhodiola kirilowii]
MAPKRPPPLECTPSVMDEEAPHGNKEEEEKELVPDSRLLKSAAEHEQADLDYSDDTPLVNKPKTSKRAEELKKQGQRVFSDESEFVILKGMEEFISKYGKDFIADFNELYEYVKTGLNVDVSNSQLMTKIQNLKKKYRKNDEKVKNGEELKPRDQTLYDLSKKIWGNWDVKTVSVVVSDVASSSNGRAKRVKKKKVVMVVKKEELLAYSQREFDSFNDA